MVIGYNSGKSLLSLQESFQQRRKRVNGDRKYRVIQCTGYLKSWSSSSSNVVSMSTDEDGDPDHDVDFNKALENAHGAMDCLVAVGRVHSPLDRCIDDAVHRGLELVAGVEFSARHSMDGMFIFIDPKMTPILGYLPQELTGSSVYEHVLYDDIPGLVEGHRRALKERGEVKVAAVKFRYCI